MPCIRRRSFYNFESCEPKSLNKKGKNFKKDHTPQCVPRDVNLKEAKIKDVERLLELHFGEDWFQNANLSFYTKVFNQQQGISVADRNENEDEDADTLDFELMDEEE